VRQTMIWRTLQESFWTLEHWAHALNPKPMIFFFQSKLMDLLQILNPWFYFILNRSLWTCSKWVVGTSTVGLGCTTPSNTRKMSHGHCAINSQPHHHHTWEVKSWTGKQWPKDYPCGQMMSQ
jgi:hypothetical protein